MSDQGGRLNRRAWAEERLAEQNPEALFAEGLDEAIVGIATRAGEPVLVIYDEDRVLEIVMDWGMSEGEALEYISYNIAGSWVGNQTPLMMEPYPDE